MSDPEIHDDTTNRFVAALHTLESTSDTADMAALFTDDATVSSIDGLGDRTGGDGIAALFTTYLEQFDSIGTTFTGVTESVDGGSGRASLEWTSEATSPDGREIGYRGVTTIDIADGRVTGFRTVYDSAALLQRPPQD